MKWIYTTLCAFGIFQCLNAQTIVMPQYGHDTARICSGTITDFSAGNNVERFTSSLLYMFPSGPGSYLKLTFTDFSLGPKDQLTISNGFGTSGTLIGSFNGDNIPTEVYSSGKDGTLELYFNSEASSLYRGFTASVQCVTSLPPADFTFSPYMHTYHKYQQPVPAGCEFNVFAHVVNKGVTARACSTSLFLSADSVLDNTDQLLTQLKSDTLNGGEDSWKGEPFNIPASTLPGDYYLIYYIDRQNQVPESNENNNKYAAPFKVLAPVIDISFRDAALPASSRPGASENLSGSFINFGNCTLDSAEVGVYFSKDNSLDNTDVPAGIISGKATNYPGNNQYIGRLRIPFSLSPGNYFVILVADPQHKITETNEQNNLAIIPLNVGEAIADIKIKSISVDDVWMKGGYTTISYMLDVKDIPFDQPFPAQFFLSEDTMPGGDDILIAKDTAHYSYYGTIGGWFRYNVPKNLPYTNYFLIMLLDPENNTPEINETNNKFTFPVKLNSYEIDVAMQHYALVSDKAPIPLGGTVQFISLVRNLKGGNCPPFKISYFLSADTVWNNTDIFLKDKMTTQIDGYNSLYLADTVQLPQTISPGNYYILSLADRYNQLVELKNNNLAFFPVKVTQPFVDLSVNHFYMPDGNPDTIAKFFSGEIRTGVHNFGNAVSDTSLHAVLLSSDEFPDAGDLVLATQKINPILTGYLYTPCNISIPATVPDGNYYFISMADYGNKIAESDETNNYTAYKFAYGKGSFPVYNMPVSGHINHASCGEVIYDNGGNSNYLDNTDGSLTIFPSTSGNYIGLNFIDMNFETCCDYLGIYDGPSVNDSLIGNFSLAPEGIISSHPTGAITLRQHSNESNSKSGFKVVAACVSPATADLKIFSYFYNTLFVQEQSHQVFYSLTNEGTRTAPASFAGIYISADSVYDASDIYIGRHLSPNVYGKKSLGVETELTVPATIPPGDYYLIFRADYTQLIAESNETNNTCFAPIKVEAQGMDLVTSSIYVYTGYYDHIRFYAGAQMDVSAVIVNKAHKMFDTSIVAYYFSEDSILDETDLFLRYSYSGSDSSVQLYHHDTVTVPSGLGVGIYYLIAKADAKNLFTESDEQNNTAFLRVAIHPAKYELSIKAIVLDSYTPLAGETISTEFQFQDEGIIRLVYGDTITVGYYLSSDKNIDASDLLLKNSKVRYNYWATDALTIPAGTPTGTYYVIARADENNLYPELSETNNLYFSIIDVRSSSPDLMITGLSTRWQPLLQGNTTDIIYTLVNAGYGKAENVIVKTYFSTDAQLNADDELINTFQSPSLGTLAEQPVSFYYQAPAGSTGGYIIVSADASGAVVESNENNNTAVFYLTVDSKGLDFFLENCRAAVSEISAGETFPAACTLKVNGNGFGEQQTISYYLSADNTLDGADVFLSQSALVWVSPYGNYPEVKTALTIPAGIQTGDYYILFQADPSNAFAEPDENNNLGAYKIKVVAPLHDLRIASLWMKEYAAATGGVLDIEPMVFNGGSVRESQYKIGFYLSHDAQLSGNDIFIGDKTMGQVHPGFLDSAQLGVYIPTTISPGNYFFIAHADFNNALQETNESNNTFARALSITTGFADIVCAGTSGFWPGVLDPDNLTMYFSIWNSGNLTVPNFRTAVYLSADTLADANDILLGTHAAANFFPGDQLHTGLQFDLPSGTAPGRYYMITICDYLHEVSEKNEANNIRWVPFKYKTDILDFSIYETKGKDLVNRNETNTFITALSIYGDHYESSPLSYYLSGDWLFDQRDVLMADLDSGYISQYGNKKMAGTITIPSSQQPGIFYLIAVADPQNAVDETYEFNNMVSKPLYITEAVGMAERSELYDFILFPNPSNGNINFSGHFEKEKWGDEITAEVFTSAGKCVCKQKYKNDIDLKKTISLAECANGVYILKLSGNQQNAVKKCMKID
jgi:trimeric autotransporter adhesin